MWPANFEFESYIFVVQGK